MANEQVKDVLDSTRRVHQRAHTFFAKLAEQAKQPRAQMLLSYLSSHEQHLADMIDQVEREATSKVLDTWVTSVEPVGHLAEKLDWDEASRQDAAFDDLVALGLDIDNRVIELYDDLAQRAEPPFLQDIFQNLLELERAEEKLMAKQTLRGMDL